MFDVIDFVVAPLTDLNPVKYVLSKRYRGRKRHELGARANRIFGYWISLASVALVLAGFWALL